jgi:hypothetical protein
MKCKLVFADEKVKNSYMKLKDSRTDEKYLFSITYVNNN